MVDCRRSELRSASSGTRPESTAAHASNAGDVARIAEKAGSGSRWLGAITVSCRAARSTPSGRSKRTGHVSAIAASAVWVRSTSGESTSKRCSRETTSSPPASRTLTFTRAAEVPGSTRSASPLRMKSPSGSSKSSLPTMLASSPSASTRNRPRSGAAASRESGSTTRCPRSSRSGSSRLRRASLSLR